MELPKCDGFMDFHNLIMGLRNWISKFHGWIIKVSNNYRIVEFNKWFMDSHNSIYDIYNSNVMNVIVSIIPSELWSLKILIIELHKSIYWDP